MIRFVSAAFAAALCTVSIATAQDAETMNFAVKGTNPGSGAPYEGTGRVQMAGDGVVNVEQTIAGKTTRGYGVAGPGTRSVAIYLTDPSGANALLLLEIAQDGSAKGYWTTPGANSAGTEEWTIIQ